MNKVFLSGNLTRDPEIRYTQAGKAYARIGIAVNRPYSKEKAVDFFTVVAWDKTAEFSGKYLTKGSRVLVEGNLRTNSYENKDGVKVNTVEVWVDNIEFAGSRRDDNSGGGDNNYSRNNQPAPSRKNNYDDGFGGEPIDPDDTPF